MHNYSTSTKSPLEPVGTLLKLNSCAWATRSSQITLRTCCFTLGKGANCEILWWVRYVSLSICPLTDIRNHTAELHQFLCMLNVDCDRDSVLLWQRCDMLCISGFMDDAMFLHNGPYIFLSYERTA